MRKIAAITGTRADYGIFQSVLKNIVADPKLELTLIVVGMHLSSEFGYTLREIKKDGFKIGARINVLQNADTRAAMAKSIGKCITEISKTLVQLKPDILTILGDRSEMLAGAVSATYLGIPIAHIHGGEISGNIDEPVRHAITKLAHIHLAATNESAERIIRMGEEPWRVHVVGAPGLDLILNGTIPKAGKIAKKYKLDLTKPLILVIQHSVVTEVEEASNQIYETLEAIKKLGHQTVLIYPNADAGGRKMISIIKKYEDYSFLKTFPSIPHQQYIGLMKIANVLIGNSSSGLIEAPSIGLPVVNIGTRQMGRQRARNVIDVDYDKDAIIKAVQKVLHNQSTEYQRKAFKNPYGDGNAGKQIAKILSEVKINKSLLSKRMTY